MSREATSSCAEIGDVDSEAVRVDVLRAEEDDDGVIVTERGKCSVSGCIALC